MHTNSSLRAPGLTISLALHAGTRPAPANDPLYLKDCDGCPFTGRPDHALARQCLELCIHGFGLVGSDPIRACRATDGASMVTRRGAAGQARFQPGAANLKPSLKTL